ncbi:hypothetical protein MKW98_029485 [Papaver atlanticum]|uniref:Uncharacterized protein n=2 Tax=Magnoliopsida TaxID=3398 RepID=A0AAD4SHF9_9MAGN|nr:hypothetical protein MKW98_029485 [Papaver atlanticum]
MLSPLRLLTPLNPTSTPLFSSPSCSFDFSSNCYGISEKPVVRKWGLSKQRSSSTTSKFKSGNLNSSNLWLCGCMRRDEDASSSKNEGDGEVRMFGSDEDFATKVPTQAQTMVEGSGSYMVSEFKPSSDVDYLQELLAIQQQGPRAIGFFGTRNMGFMHQQLIEILSYAMVITKNHIYTSGASGTNAAVIRGALRAERPELLTVILPQSLKMQSPESQELLSKVKNVIEKPHNDHLPLIEASRLCNWDILSNVQQVICFAFHDNVPLEPIHMTAIDTKMAKIDYQGSCSRYTKIALVVVVSAGLYHVMLRECKWRTEQLTVILPQSLKMQSPESQELLSKVKNVIEKPHNDHLPLIEASRLCNWDILSNVQQVICFAFLDSRLLMETCQGAKNLRKIVTLFYLD